MTCVCPHSRGLLGKGSPRVCVPLLCRAPHSLAGRPDLAENSQGCSLCGRWALTPRWGFQNGGSVSGRILSGHALPRSGLGPRCLLWSLTAMGRGGGLDFCLEPTAGAWVASLWGTSPVRSTPRPPPRLPGSPLLTRTEMLPPCPWASPVQGPAPPEALATLVPGLTPRPRWHQTGFYLTNRNGTVPGSRAGVSCGSGSHGPDGAHTGGLPRGPQPCGQTGAELKPSFPTGMGDPPELLAAQVLSLPVVCTNPGSGIHVMTWGQARSWGAGSPQWDRGARRTSVRPLAPQPFPL